MYAMHGRQLEDLDKKIKLPKYMDVVNHPKFDAFEKKLAKLNEFTSDENGESGTPSRDPESAAA